MYQIPPHLSASDIRPIAAFVVVVVLFLILTLSVTDLTRDGVDPIPRPLPAGATLDLRLGRLGS
jgi:uncharacterized membrane protein